MLFAVICLIIVVSLVSSEETLQPNIVFIVADDLGWDDVSFHGSDNILTPNIDVLAYEGVILNQYYTDTEGTASRSAFFTGKYAMRLGTQGISISAAEDRGIPITELLLPSYLQKLGYSTHLVGKWNVGESREHYLPTYRGFDSFYGFVGRSVDYLTYNLIENCNGADYYGLDLFENREPVFDQTGHLTEILTDQAIRIIRDHNTSVPLYLHISHAAPHAGGGFVNLQPPLDSIEANGYIAHSARRLYAGLVTSLDKSIGHILSMLAEREILDNTIIVFVSDNGAAPIGPSQNFGSNLPLRGVKGSPWEGAARGVAFLWHSSISSKIHDGLFHVTDWLPTLVNVAGGNIPENIDGVNQWDTINSDERPKRLDVLITIDDLNGWAAFREGDFKIIIGNVNRNFSGYYSKELKVLRNTIPSYENMLLECDANRIIRETLDLVLDVDLAFAKRKELSMTYINENEINTEPCVPTQAKGCLYNITADPTESNDLWNNLPDLVRHLTLRLRTLWADMVPRRQPQLDPKANPSFHNYIWYPWVENDEVVLEPPKVPTFPLQVSVDELEYLVDINMNTFRDNLNLYIKDMSKSFIRSVSALFSL
ncbi:arylsulfatase B-like [Galleria mellonella]|uniref:Arylsulfatase B-like n=1 Tax=Galleria mellonella TaxID=7137 RepID=A0A6J3C6R1_GALME|nr:arylsulfatase B-like [Galleria mellonella]